MIEKIIIFGIPPGRVLEWFLVDFELQIQRVWEAKSRSQIGSVTGTAICKKQRKTQWFFKILMFSGGRIFNENWLQIWKISGSISDPLKNQVFLEFMLKIIAFWGSPF